MRSHRAQFASLMLIGCYAAQASAVEAGPTFHRLGSADKAKTAEQAEQKGAELPSVTFEMKAHYHSDGRVELRCEQVHTPIRGNADDNRQEKQK